MQSENIYTVVIGELIESVNDNEPAPPELFHCPRCNQDKPADEFYANKARKNGISNYCKQCLKDYSAQKKYRRHKREQTQPRSSKEAISFLAKHGIPAGHGDNYVDVLAWGCIEIEAKGSKLNEDGQYQWIFNPNQRNKDKGLVMFIAWESPNRTRVYILPRNHKLLSEKSGLSVVPYSSHGNANIWQELSQYENAYWLIEEARLNYAAQIRA